MTKGIICERLIVFTVGRWRIFEMTSVSHLSGSKRFKQLGDDDGDDDDNDDDDDDDDDDDSLYWL